MRDSELHISKTSGWKAITQIPGWAQELRASRDTLNGVEAAYARVPLIFRAVRLRCDALAAIPAHVRTQRGRELAWPFAGTPLRELIWRTEAALLFTGASYWLKQSNAMRTVALEWLNPTTMRVEMLADGSLRFHQQVGARTFGPWAEDEIVYIRDFSLADDVGPGVASVQVALQDAQLQHYIKRFTALYFEGGAMPITLLGFDTTPDKDEAERIEGFFRRATSGIRNAWKVLALRSGVTPTLLTQDLAKMAMPELDNSTRRNIALAFGIPQTLLEDAANYATAAEHRMGFYEETIRPRASLIADAVNAQLFAGINAKLELAVEELDIYQTDEAQRAGSLGQLTAAGIPLDLAMEILGYDLSEEQWLRVRGAVPASEPEPQQPDAEPQKADMGRWERKALKRIKDGKSASCEFASAAIPEHVAAAVRSMLRRASSADSVREIFKTVAYYERALRRAVLDFYRGDIDAGAFIDELVRLVDAQFRRAWNEGARDAGFEPSEMEPEDTDELQQRIEAELEYVLDFASAVEAAREQQSGVDALYERVPLWANRYNEVCNDAKLHFSGDNQKFVWRLGASEQHCATCAALDGVVARKKAWEERVLQPQHAPNPALECEGWKCQCSLEPTDEPMTRGGIPNG